MAKNLRLILILLCSLSWELAFASQFERWCLLRQLMYVRDANNSSPLVHIDKHSRVKNYRMENHNRPITETDLAKLNVPLFFRRFFDSEGNFNYQPEQVKTLALENGDQELALLRMHFDNNYVNLVESKALEMTPLVLNDLSKIVSSLIPHEGRMHSETDFNLGWNPPESVMFTHISEQVEHQLTGKVLQYLREQNMDAEANKLYISELQLQELARVLEAMPKTKLLVSYYREHIGNTPEQIINKLPIDLQARIELVEVSWQAANASAWTQDASKPLLDMNTLSSMRAESEYGPRSTDLQVIYELGSKGHLNEQQSPFVFQGGNIVVGEQHIFMGEDIINFNAQRIGASPREIVVALRQEFGKPVIPLLQVDFHIDLSMAVAKNLKTNKEVILIASQELAIDLLLTPEIKQKLQHLDRPVTMQDLIELHGEGSFTSMLKREGQFDLEQMIAAASKRPEILAYMAARTAKLKRQKEYFKQLGYEVREVPDLGIIDAQSLRSARAGERSNVDPNSMELQSAQAPDMLQAFNYTNAIFSGDHAIVARMGVRVWDQYVEQLLTGLGYRHVHVLETPRYSLCMQGGIRCLSETYRHP